MNQETKRSKPADMKSTSIRHGDEVEPKAQANTSSELSETDELELLQSLYFQFCFAEAKEEDTFLRQEQSAQSQMLAAWEVLHSKLHQLHETSLRLDHQRHADLIQSHIENLSEPSAMPAEQLPKVLGSVSQLYTSIETALDRLTCSGISCTDIFQLKQQMEALTVELDNLLEQIKSTNISDVISSTVSVRHDMQRLSDRSAMALLQIAHLVKELRVEDRKPHTIGKHD